MWFDLQRSLVSDTSYLCDEVGQFLASLLGNTAAEVCRLAGGKTTDIKYRMIAIRTRVAALCSSPSWGRLVFMAALGQPQVVGFAPVPLPSAPLLNVNVMGHLIAYLLWDSLQYFVVPIAHKQLVGLVTESNISFGLHPLP